MPDNHAAITKRDRRQQNQYGFKIGFEGHGDDKISHSDRYQHEGKELGLELCLALCTANVTALHIWMPRIKIWEEAVI